MDQVMEQIAEFGVLPVVVVDDAAHAAPLADALRIGGIPCAEITLRTPSALDAIAAMTEVDVVLGAGTVLTVQQVDQALEAGARFIVSPGFSRSVVRACRDRGVPVLPGVATATEIQMALDEGVDVVKFFPAEVLGGVPALRALSAPFGSVRFIPTGGVVSDTLADYLQLPSVLAAGGSWMVAPDLLRTARFGEISRRVRDAAATVTDVRRDTRTL